MKIINKYLSDFAFSYSERVKFYNILFNMMSEPANLTVYEALEELYLLESKYTIAFYRYEKIIYNLKNVDANLSVVLSNYVPSQDSLILSTSEYDDITNGFKNLIEINKDMHEMKKILVQALSYPLIMLGILLIIIYYFSITLIPNLVDNITDFSKVSSSTKFLIFISNNFYLWFSALLIILILMIIIIIKSLKNYTGRFRNYLDSIPPYNLYKILSGCGFLLALNALNKSGYIQYEALEEISKTANVYLKDKIAILLKLMESGLDVGQALVKSKMNFPDKSFILELSIILKYSDGESLELMAKSLAKVGLNLILAQSKILNFIVSILVFSIISFLYYAIYQVGMDLSNQVN